MAQSEASLAREAGKRWWWFIVSGILWLMIAVVVLRIDTPQDFAESLTVVGVLVGVVLLMGGINEFLAMSVREGWKWVHAVLGVIFILGGLWGLFNPIGTFFALTSILGFVLMLKGAFDITLALVTKEENDLWWLGLTVGILEILLAFWVSVPESLIVQQTRRTLFLIIWVGFGALFRGIGELVLAFQLRKLGKEA